MKNTLSLFLFALLFVACGDDSSSTSAINLNDGEKIGFMTDSRDGQIYKTVKISDQTWMAQNLNYETANSYCYYDKVDNCSKYGRLYTWAAAMGETEKDCGKGHDCSFLSGNIQGVCPSGWHLPSLTEWKALFTAVGGDSTAGRVLRSSLDWCLGGGTDDFSFSALPTGYRNERGNFDYACSYAFFWSSSINSSIVYSYGGQSLGYNHDYAISMFIDNYGSVGLYNNYKDYGFSVRCLKDADKFASVTDSRDGQTYRTVKIGTQTWMAQNLNYKTANSYCYEDVSVNCFKYGRLYTWAAAMDSASFWSTNGKGCGYGSTCSPTYPVRGVCPDGWHLPTRTEWNTLFSAVGDSSTAGQALKSTSGWYNIHNGSDAFSFRALPAGFKGKNGNYDGESSNAFFWSSTEYNASIAYYMNLHYSTGNARLYRYDEYYGYSVRCLKD